TVRDPGALVTAYFRLFERLGGKFVRGAAGKLEREDAGWSASVEGQRHRAKQAVIALGPWAPDVLEPLGYRLPLFVKRGYHMHYDSTHGAKLNQLVLDAEVGYALAPMARGIRLTTGAEFAMRDAVPSPIQLGKAERAARELLDLGPRLDATP